MDIDFDKIEVDERGEENIEIEKEEIKDWLLKTDERSIMPIAVAPDIEAPIGIDEAVKNRAKELENKAFEQDIQLKKNAFIVLIAFLAFETIAIFLYAFFQAVEFKGFKLEQWSFNLLVSATIAQITFMVQMTVKHLFPERKSN
ncbi:MAG: hypothetical protein ABIC36_03210 [bacterium]